MYNVIQVLWQKRQKYQQQQHLIIKKLIEQTSQSTNHSVAPQSTTHVSIFHSFSHHLQIFYIRYNNHNNYSNTTKIIIITTIIIILNNSNNRKPVLNYLIHTE